MSELEESYPESGLTLRSSRCADDDEDLLFLFLSEQEVFLKLTRHCNNHCRFCCDTVFWNGTDMPAQRVRAKIEEGASRGYRRLFLSGGEPTIHPNYLEFIEFAKNLDYTEIITISNGRMFFYPDFSVQAVGAGLTAVIVSLNSHDERTHDTLVSVKGAFRQARRGIQNLRRLGCKVNLSAVVNQCNVSELSDLVRAYHRWGAGAATFMQLIPNDRDWERSRRVLYYDLESGRSSVRAALGVAAELGLAVEFKKFPDNFFEGYEEQIQEPVGWALEVAEIAWRRPERFAPFLLGKAIRCFGSRCEHCAYRAFCGYLMEHQARRRDGRFDGFCVDVALCPSPDQSTLLAAMERQPSAPVWATGSDVQAVRPWLEASSERPVSLQLGSMEGVESIPSRVTLVLGDHLQLERAKRLPHAVEVVLNRLTLPWLQRNPDWIVSKGTDLTISPQVFLRLEAARRGQADLSDCLRELPLREARLRAVPPCLGGRDGSGRLPWRVPAALLLQEEDVSTHARHFFWRRYYSKSVRCGDCRATGQCDGVHINYVRQFGYRALRPLT